MPKHLSSPNRKRRYTRAHTSAEATLTQLGSVLTSREHRLPYLLRWDSCLGDTPSLVFGMPRKHNQIKSLLSSVSPRYDLLSPVPLHTFFLAGQ